jgi:hypothetical protein
MRLYILILAVLYSFSLHIFVALQQLFYRSIEHTWLLIDIHFHAYAWNKSCALLIRKRSTCSCYFAKLILREKINDGHPTVGIYDVGNKGEDTMAVAVSARTYIYLHHSAARQLKIKAPGLIEVERDSMPEYECWACTRTADCLRSFGPLVINDSMSHTRYCKTDPV